MSPTPHSTRRSARGTSALRFALPNLSLSTVDPQADSCEPPTHRISRVPIWACSRHVVDGEGPFAAQVAGEGEPPAQHRADAVAVAGEEADVDEQPHPPAQEPAEMQLEGGDDGAPAGDVGGRAQVVVAERLVDAMPAGHLNDPAPGDRKSTRLNSSHVEISYAVFCLKKKK